MKFILSRTDDYRHHSKKWIVGYGFLFWLITRILMVVVMFACGAIYEHYGIDAEQLTKFAGDPTNLKSMLSPGYAVLLLGIVAPILEECIFRLGLSFKRWQIAAGLAAIPLYIMFQRLGTLTLSSGLLFVLVTIVVFCAVYSPFNQTFWSKLKVSWYHPMIWISSIAFGLLHLMAFTDFALYLLPYMLCIVAMPFFGGCAIAYYRINLGFWWGVGLHIFNNLPAIMVVALT